MKNIFLSVVVVTTLVAAGLGGTFAHFSDTETVEDNWIQTGSIDLKVNGYDDPDIPIKISAQDIQPCESADFTIELRNDGQPEGDLCYVYMHIKNAECTSVPVTKTGDLRPEPEVVAEDGGWLGQVYTPGLGKQGDTCNLLDFIDITIEYDGDGDGTMETVYDGKIGPIICENINLGQLLKCTTKELKIDVHLQDISEDDLGTLIGPDPFFTGVDNDGDGLVDEDPRDGIDNDMDGLVDEDPADETGHFDAADPDVKEKSWDHWPTNALMKDRVTFDIMFSLVQVP